MHLCGWVHVNVNCSDFERSKRFYERLGFRQLATPLETHTGEVAAAVGTERYRIRGGLFALEGGGQGAPMIDLLEWREPDVPSRPYPNLHNLGIARIALRTSDLDADVRTLREAGVAFVSEEPATVVWPGMPTSRFICFEDPDGSVIELVELQIG